MDLTILIIYGLFLTFILLYSFMQLNLTIAYRARHRKQEEWQKEDPDHFEWPRVTVQLPVYNELYVVERLIDAVAKLDYPLDKLDIQVLDDGNDESVEVAARKVAYWKSQRLDIEHIRREDRVGFKAGALEYGLGIAKGEFTAIFDADFIPDPQFLRKTMPYFKSGNKIGVVQTRWEHLNEDYSILTRLQAFGLDAHFTIEQLGRNARGHFINFNGTAGVWRNECIKDAGGWQHDTITEDLDLSYRAQLKGWNFVYLEEVGSPAELPAEMNALKNQQFRWTKGAAECAVKNLPSVIKKRGIGLGTKVHAVFHLMNSFIFICVLGSALLSLPILLVKIGTSDYDLMFNLASVFLFSFMVLAYYYWTSRKYRGDSFLTFLRDFPLFLAVSMGMSLHNSIAVIEGYLGRKTPFVRTPKFAISGEGDGSWSDKKYRALKANPLTIIEALLAIYFFGGVVLGIYHQEFGMLPFHIMLFIGFTYVAWLSFKHTRVA
ncbi:MAG: glycosyltransferase family 2 protein [Flavobacteriales bacterium]|nr:glycosyltransferase family 2 protein [Flavobacteriales bacterium]